MTKMYKSFVFTPRTGLKLLIFKNAHPEMNCDRLDHIRFGRRTCSTAPESDVGSLSKSLRMGVFYQAK